MKVFYTTSLRNVAKNRDRLETIYVLIEKLGHTNLDKVLFNIPDSKKFYDGLHKEKLSHYNRMIACIKKADVVLLEVSTQSLSMGFILHTALGMNKPVIALHTSGKSPFFVQGIEDKRLRVQEYDLETIEKVLTEALEFAQETFDVRFDFFISPEISMHLDTLARENRVPKSVYLRSLIETDMAKEN
ncbi:MAG: hypothetical protein COU68_04325 [Candidatus Pacebacteria bacterium CG10_big_fil_rev_8_21_14_0_10_45_6]|nr:MAG: hypothetical protein COU68_04325 [Candidatus Pacebacteria bacterium CG10_big_fil_rev_8_21_14_0_10_45_6]